MSLYNRVGSDPGTARATFKVPRPERTPRRPDNPPRFWTTDDARPPRRAVNTRSARVCTGEGF